jgi:hypothetical protein
LPGIAKPGGGANSLPWLQAFLGFDQIIWLGGIRFARREVRRETERLKLDATLVPYALSAYCRTSDLTPDLRLPEVERLGHRAELAQLFGIPRADFTAEDVRRAREIELDADGMVA